MNRLLSHQIKQTLGNDFDVTSLDDNLQKLLKNVSLSYEKFDNDKELLLKQKSTINKQTNHLKSSAQIHNITNIISSIVTDNDADRFHRTLQTSVDSLINILKVDRASIWLLNDMKTSLTCKEMYEVINDTYSNDASLSQKDYPTYFNFLLKNQSIVVNDIFNNEATSELHEYANAYSVKSLLDIPIIRKGSVVGVVCCETVNDYRKWNEEDKEFAENISKSISIVLEVKNVLDSSNAKSEFLANMSHEIRTPLNAIMGFIELLKEEHQDLKYLETIDTSSKSLLKIINDILDFSKIESGKLDIEYIDFDPIYEFQSSKDLFQTKCDEKSIKFHAIFENLPKALRGDPLRIKQVINNLLSNAIKFTPESLNIYLNINYTDSNLFISVKDEGIGISPENQERIFTSFTQADSSTTREYGGTGLGLSISANLVNLMDGELKVNSEVGVGSNFSFHLPLKEAKAIVQPIISDVSTDFSNLKILLVEDNKANQIFMKVVFKKISIMYDIANDGLEAIQMFKDNTYDLILMDENMPNMNGIRATKKIRSIEAEQNIKRIPIIALTANALKGDRERFLAADMDEYLTKPISGHTLSNTLAKMLNIKPLS